MILRSKKPLWLYQGLCVFVGPKLQRILAFFRVMRLQREVETLDRRRAFDRQLLTDTLLVFKAAEFRDNPRSRTA